MSAGGKAAAANGAPISVALVHTRLKAFAAKSTKGEVSPDLRDAIMKHAKRNLPSLEQRAGALTLPRKFMDPLGRARWEQPRPELHAALTLALDGAKVVARMRGILKALHAFDAKITDAVGHDFIRQLVVKYEKRAARVLTAEQRQALVWKLVGAGGEATAIRNAEFLDLIADEVGEVLKLVSDARFLKRFGLADIDPTPLLFTTVKTAGRVGSAEARLPYVDFAVLFRCTTVDGADRYLLKVRGQVKLGRVDLLVGGIDVDGEYRLGQLVKDDIRAPRGAWHFHGIRIAQDMLIQDRRLTRKVTFGSREFTKEELASLMAEGIVTRHIIHEVSYEAFYRWAERLIKLLRISTKPAK